MIGTSEGSTSSTRFQNVPGDTVRSVGSTVVHRQVHDRLRATPATGNGFSRRTSWNLVNIRSTTTVVAIANAAVTASRGISQPTTASARAARRRCVARAAVVLRQPRHARGDPIDRVVQTIPLAYSSRISVAQAIELDADQAARFRDAPLHGADRRAEQRRRSLRSDDRRSPRAGTDRAACAAAPSRLARSPCASSREIRIASGDGSARGKLHRPLRRWSTLPKRSNHDRSDRRRSIALRQTMRMNQPRKAAGSCSASRRVQAATEASCTASSASLGWPTAASASAARRGQVRPRSAGRTPRGRRSSQVLPAERLPGWPRPARRSATSASAASVRPVHAT